jgi:hypothetical protein
LGLPRNLAHEGRRNNLSYSKLGRWQYPTCRKSAWPDFDPAYPVLGGCRLGANRASARSRNHHEIEVFREGELAERGEITLLEAAQRLDVAQMTVHRMVTLGRLQAKQVCRGAPWVLKAADVAEFAIMDNLGSHKGKVIRKLIRYDRAKLFFLPKYSPDLNPIEQVFAKLKHLLRKAAARAADAVCAAIGNALEAFTPQERANYLENSGYRT